MGVTEGVSIPNLNKVLLVQGLAANLISISQLCDEGFNAKFTKDECIITNEASEEVMKGFRSKDNFYLWKPDTPVHPSGYSMIKEELKMYYHEFDESYDSDESDKESYINDLTISELSTNRERKLEKLNVSNDPKVQSKSNVTENVATTSKDNVTEKDSATPEESSNPNRVLKVVPLRTISSDEVKATKPKMTHAKRPKEGIHNKGNKCSASATMEKLTKEGSKYVDSAITRIVNRILKENHQVPGISIPLQTIMTDPLNNTSKADTVHTVDSDLKINKDEQGITKNTNVTKDVNDIDNNEHPKANTETNTNVVDLDEYSEDELLTSLNPSVANRLMTRRKGKVVVQGSSKGSTQVNNPIKDTVRRKSTSAGPVKSKVVTKSKGVGPSKSWSRVIPKKRKKWEIVEPESDVEANVPDIPSRKKPTTSKLAANIPEVPIDNVSFHYASSVSRWKYVLQKRLAVERELAPNALEKRSKSADYIKVFVRGKCVSCSPSVINQFLGRTDEAQTELEVTDNQVCQVITAKQVKSWPMKEKLTASKLSIKYAMLHKIGAANWVPTNHKSTISTVLGRFLYVVGTKAKFDYGAYIFDQTMKHAGSFSVKGPIAFLSLLSGIILDQYPNILNEHDVVCKRESPLAFHYKLFKGKHVPDIVMTSAETSKSGASVSKAEVITILKETCK
ncbi:uncharacterized protein LOC131649141 [Vicia villosa]|uniref:uncharacterized protein LOC131649141 n=1 Tax=Vicia villosa TaxID=3911 RepID=UPI00273B215A|nr:uncharacterized protein LOC131649141 [Vicia villosa]